MTRELNNARYDLYTTVHKGLRAHMVDVLTAAARVDEADATDVSRFVLRVRELLDICRDHLEHENHFLHTALEARRPGSAQLTASEHEEQELAFKEIEAQIQGIERSHGDGRKAAILGLYRRLALFVADNFDHMQAEEVENNASLWEAYTDVELHDLHISIIAAVSPARMPIYSRWMLPNISHSERLGVLTGIRRTVPAEAFDKILSIVRAGIAVGEWQKLCDSMELAAAPA